MNDKDMISVVNIKDVEQIIQTDLRQSAADYLFIKCDGYTISEEALQIASNELIKSQPDLLIMGLIHSNLADDDECIPDYKEMRDLHKSVFCSVDFSASDGIGGPDFLEYLVSCDAYKAYSNIGQMIIRRSLLEELITSKMPNMALLSFELMLKARKVSCISLPLVRCDAASSVASDVSTELKIYGGMKRIIADCRLHGAPEAAARRIAHDKLDLVRRLYLKLEPEEKKTTEAGSELGREIFEMEIKEPAELLLQLDEARMKIRELTRICAEASAAELNAGNKLKKLDKELKAAKVYEAENRSLIEKINKLKKEKADIKSSLSFRIGRVITWPFRKIRDLT